VVTAPLLELKTFQSTHIQDFYGSWGNPTNKTLLFQFCKCALSGSGGYAEIVRKIKPVQR